LHRHSVVGQLTPIGAEVADYLRHKRKRLTDSSYRDYGSGLDKLARHFPDLRLEDFEPPTGTERLEQLLDDRWGDGAPRTYNKNLSILKDFFEQRRPVPFAHGSLRPAAPWRERSPKPGQRYTAADVQRPAPLARLRRLPLGHVMASPSRWGRYFGAR
jgi:hypothetical protein